MKKQKILELILLIIVIAISITAIAVSQKAEPEEPIEQKVPPLFTVVVDPGHGGEFPGCIRDGVKEKDLTLEISERLKNAFESRSVAVIMTRNDDTDVSLDERCEIANESEAALFISIHANSFEDSSISGFESYYYHDSAEGKRLSDIVLDYAQKSGISVRYSREQDYHVIRETRLPAILIETGYMTNPDELELLQTEEYQTILAEAIAEAAIDYMKEVPHD